MATSSTTRSNSRKGQKSKEDGQVVTQPLDPKQDVVASFKEYARQRPDVTALWCFGIGFVVGWKLKPW